MPQRRPASLHAARPRDAWCTFNRNPRLLASDPAVPGPWARRFCCRVRGAPAVRAAAAAAEVAFRSPCEGGLPSYPLAGPPAPHLPSPDTWSLGAQDPAPPPRRRRGGPRWRGAGGAAGRTRVGAHDTGPGRVGTRAPARVDSATPAQPAGTRPRRAMGWQGCVQPSWVMYTPFLVVIVFKLPRRLQGLI